jgi:hypothetical protein
MQLETLIDALSPRLKSRVGKEDSGVPGDRLYGNNYFSNKRREPLPE